MAEIVRLAGGNGILEVGPGAVLRGLFRQFDRRLRVATCGGLDDCRTHLADRVAQVAPLSG